MCVFLFFLVIFYKFSKIVSHNLSRHTNDFAISENV